MDEVSYERQAEMVREHISSVLQILSTMQEMDANKEREAARLLGASSENAEQVLQIIRMVRGESYDNLTDAVPAYRGACAACYA